MSVTDGIFYRLRVLLNIILFFYYFCVMNSVSYRPR